MPKRGSNQRAKIPTVFEHETAQEYMLALCKESDRGCALIAGAWIDERLASLLHTRFKADSGDNPTLFDWLLWGRPLPPLGSTAVKRKLCQALGLIDPATSETIDRIATIRNHFAHFAREASFDDAEIGDKVTPLEQFAAEFLSTRPQVLDALDLVCVGFPVARTAFTRATGAVIVALVYSEAVIIDNQEKSQQPSDN